MKRIKTLEVFDQQIKEKEAAKVREGGEPVGIVDNPSGKRYNGKKQHQSEQLFPDTGVTSSKNFEHNEFRSQFELGNAMPGPIRQVKAGFVVMEG
jgi:hypothetical protein